MKNHEETFTGAKMDYTGDVKGNYSTLITFTQTFNSSLIQMNNQSNLSADSFDQAIAISINSFQRYVEFDLDSILRSIAFPIVFVIVSIQYLNELLTEMQFELPEFYSPKPVQSPLFLINEQLQSVTVKNLRKMQSFPKSYKKQDMINALLITF